MILNFLLIFVASAILFFAFMPRPRIEDAKAQEFDERGFPQATENSPIPYLIGKTRLETPNTLFVGGFRTKKIKKKVKSGLFSSKKVTVGYKYYLTIDLGLCLGGDTPCALHEIWVDDKRIWSGHVTSNSTFRVEDMELFGGKENGGGFASNVRFYPGTFDQPKDSYIDAMPESKGMLTPYRGVCHIVFENAYIGESAQLRKMSFVVSRFTNELQKLTGRVGTEGTNVSEAIYEVMVNNWGGLETPRELIDFANFQDASDTLLSEGQGVAGVVTRETNGENLIGEFCKQIDALLTVEPVDNRLILKLLRADYDPNALLTFGPSSIVDVISFSQTMWSELVSEVKVGFKDSSNNYQDATAISQDLAVATMTGRLNSVSFQMPFVKDAELANTIAGRDLNQLSQVATNVRLKVNRRAFALRPGSVFKWNWPDYGISPESPAKRTVMPETDWIFFVVVGESVMKNRYGRIAHREPARQVEL